MTLDETIKWFGARWLKPDDVVKIIDERDRLKAALELCKSQRNKWAYDPMNSKILYTLADQDKQLDAILAGSGE
jgi:hypothetical protein